MCDSVEQRTFTAQRCPLDDEETQHSLKNPGEPFLLCSRRRFDLAISTIFLRQRKQNGGPRGFAHVPRVHFELGSAFTDASAEAVQIQKVDFHMGSVCLNVC